MNLPPEFIRNIEGTFGEAGRQFIANLPVSIDEASQRWGLSAVRPVPTLSYNFVAFATRAAQSWCSCRERSDERQRGTQSKREVVLKMGVPDRELNSELAALRLFNGEGACHLIDYDEEKYWMLLERLNPGIMLVTLKDDEEATRIAAEVMQKIWRPVDALESASLLASLESTSLLETLESDSLLSSLESASLLAELQEPTSSGRPAPQNFIQLSDWFNGLKKLRARFDGGTGPFDEKLVERVEHSVKEFFAEDHKPVLMHGDFHHFNILSSERGWLVIDPKGVIGPACYEVGPFLLNPWSDLLKLDNHRRMTERRIEILHECLGFERERIRAWGMAHALLSAWWSMESYGDWQYAAAFAEMIADLPLNS